MIGFEEQTSNNNMENNNNNKFLTLEDALDNMEFLLSSYQALLKQVLFYTETEVTVSSKKFREALDLLKEHVNL